MESLNKVLKSLQNANQQIQSVKCLSRSGGNGGVGELKLCRKRLMLLIRIRLFKALKEIKSFFGITIYYKRFITDYC